MALHGRAGEQRFATLVSVAAGGATALADPRHRGQHLRPRSARRSTAPKPCCRLARSRLEEKVAALVGGARRIAMEYSPDNAIPYVNWIDAGTKEMVERATGA